MPFIQIRRRPINITRLQFIHRPTPLRPILVHQSAETVLFILSTGICVLYRTSPQENVFAVALGNMPLAEVDVAAELGVVYLLVGLFLVQ
jgi:hypothetical protein